jgi:hypothetical protein
MEKRNWLHFSQDIFGAALKKKKVEEMFSNCFRGSVAEQDGVLDF